ncbi:DNA cytosine methyltransferase [Methylomonas sp. HYX-M1]|uniref:DNA cytosine methyltransferase n=1 Tax=Methylomonas sp. HYX-M1 TaxID=3139307 RepID=UPI00345C1E33
MDHKLIVDLFAGGGGVSEGIFMATGRHPDIAINHSDDALSMHRVNHPNTRHFIADVYDVCPKGATQGKPVGWLHLSPDCTHHSQASGGQPRSKKIRGLAWVGYRWAGQVKPDVISLENVTQILKWGPLIAKRDKATGRVVTLDMVTCPVTGRKTNRIAEPGERVPVRGQYLVPDPRRAGQTWSRFTGELRKLGYNIEYRTLCAADFGTPTTRERLFMIARSDGQPINWPEPTHFKNPAAGQAKWRAAAECIDFSIPCQSIFNRKKPLADATMKRVAKGLKRYVLDSANPFIVQIAHYNGSDRAHSISDPLKTITAGTKGGEFALATPIIVQAGHGEGKPGSTQRRGVGSIDMEYPLGTVVSSGGGFSLSTAYLAQMNGGFNETTGRDLRDPMTTITNSGSQQQVVAAHLTHLRGNCDARDINEPVRTISAGGEHHGVVSAFLSRQFGNSVGQPVTEPAPTVMTDGLGKTAVVAATLITNTSGHDATDLTDPTPTVTTGNHHGLVSAFISSYYTDESNRSRSMEDPAATITTENRLGLVECTLSPEHEESAQRVSAFLCRYYSEGGQHNAITDPMATITTKDQLALVTVTIEGHPYVIVDIGLRMLQPAELFRAQGFRQSYAIEHGHDGRKFTKTTQVRLCGNSVPPELMAALVRANHQETDINLAQSAA